MDFVPQQDDVLCEPCDILSDASGPILFIPEDEDIDIF